MFVTKFDGRKEGFSREKITRTCARAGMKMEDAIAISERIERRSANGMSTEDIYRMVLEEINSKHKILFRLREAIARLDPQSFEIYVKRLLESSGYKCEWDRLLDGKCIEHQVDIVAEKEGKRYIVECKHHRNHHRYLGLGIALQVQARLEDILDKGHVFRAWLVTNTKFSEHAKTYSGKKDILLTGWGYNGELALEKLIHGSMMYPITLLDAGNDIRRLLAKRMVTVSDVAESGKMAASIIGQNNFDSLMKQVQELAA